MGVGKPWLLKTVVVNQAPPFGEGLDDEIGAEDNGGDEGEEEGGGGDVDCRLVLVMFLGEREEQREKGVSHSQVPRWAVRRDLIQ